MKNVLIRYWFVFSLLTAVIFGLLWPDFFDDKMAWLKPNMVIVTALFLIALTMPGRRVTDEVRRPWAALYAVLISYGFLPAAAWFLGAWMRADFHVGAFITVCGPCTLASAVLWTRLAGGNEATALLATVFSTASSWLLTTLWLTATTGTAVALDPFVMMSELLLYLVLPIGVGQLLRQWQPILHVATRHRFALGICSQLLILAILLRSAAKVGLNLRGESVNLTWLELGSSGLFCVGLHLAALAFGWWSSPWLGIDRPRQTAIAFACSQKTLPVALLVFDGYFETRFPLAIVAILFYHAGQLICDTAIAERMGQVRETSTASMPTGDKAID
jgi:sodium/bile acid cotransporter 7